MATAVTVEMDLSQGTEEETVTDTFTRSPSTTVGLDDPVERHAKFQAGTCPT